VSPPVAQAATELGLDLHQTESVNLDSTVAAVQGAGAELGVVCAFGQLIQDPLLSELELLNIHPSLVPRWRGAAPIERAIMAGDERTGVSIVLRALEEPIRQLAYNAGLEGSIVVDKIRNGPKGQGLNVETGEYEDLIKAGITDPTMVVRSALQNAASIAKNILTTEAVVAEAPEKASAGAGMPGGMGGMDMM